MFNSDWTSNTPLRYYTHMKVAVLADTHIPKRAKQLPEPAIALLKSADAIIHAGDLVSQGVLKDLMELAPVYAVLGNNDSGVSLPETLEISLDGVTIAIVHDSGPSKGRGARMRKLFPNAQVVVFGHSHIPMNVLDDGLLLFNPGSPTDRRRQVFHTMGMLHLENGVAAAELHRLD